jgi:hypothetical protein
MFDRAAVAAYLVTLLADAAGGTVTVFDRPPATFNVPALILLRPTVEYSTFSLCADEATWPVGVAAGAEQDDVLDGLAQTVRQAVAGDPNLGGTVLSAVPARQQNPRNVNVAGIDVQTVEVVLTIRM